MMNAKYLFAAVMAAGLSATAAIENEITEYRDGIPYVEKGYGLLRNYYGSGTISCIHSAMGGLADVFYVGDCDYSWGSMNLIKGGPVVTTYSRHFRPILLVDDEPYDLTFSKTYHYPFGYRSEFRVGLVRVRHEMVLDGNVILRRVRVLENPRGKKIRLRIDQSGGGLPSGVRWDFDAAKGIVFADCPVPKNGATVTNRVEIGSRAKVALPLNDRPLDPHTFRKPWEQGRNVKHFYLDSVAPGDEHVFYLAFNPKPGEDLSSARVDRVFERFAREHAGDARFVTAVPEVGGFLSSALPVARTLEVGDTGAFRASQTYWVWAWDAMVHAEALAMLGRSAEVKRMLDFFNRTAHPEKFFQFAYNADFSNSLYQFANKASLSSNSGKSYHLLFVTLLHQYWCITGDEAFKAKCLPLTRKIMQRYAAGVRAGGRILPFEGAFYPDFPSALGILTTDCSMASAGLYYQALRAYEELTGERLADIGAVKSEIEKTLWNPEKGLWSDSVDGKTLARRDVFALWGPFWVSRFAGELAPAPWDRTAANLRAEFNNGCFLQMVNLHSKCFFADGNQLSCYVPPTDRYYWNAMNLGGRTTALADFDRVLAPHARVATFPEGQMSDMRNLEPATASDNLGVKQFFTVKGWLADALDLNLGLTARPDGLRLNPLGDGRPFEVRNMSFRGKRLTIRRTGRGTVARYMLNGAPLREGFVAWTALDRAENLLEIALSPKDDGYRPSPSCAALPFASTGLVSTANGWKLREPMFGDDYVLSDFDGKTKPAGARPVTRVFRLDKPAGRPAFYRITFEAKCPERFHYWWIDSYDAAGKELSDINSALYKSDDFIPYDEVIQLQDRAAYCQLSFLAPEGTEVRDYAIRRISDAEAAEHFERIAKTLPEHSFVAPEDAFDRLPRTRAKLKSGEPLRVLMLGDSLMNDTYNGGFAALLKRDFPASDITVLLSVRGGGSTAHYRTMEYFRPFVLDQRPDLVVMGGISSSGGATKAYDDMMAFLRLCREHDLETVMLTLPMSCEFRGSAKACDTFGEAVDYGRFSKSLVRRDYIRQASAEMGVPYWDVTTPAVTASARSGKPLDWFQRDLIHNNDRAKIINARALAAYFRVASPNAPEFNVCDMPGAFRVKLHERGGVTTSGRMYLDPLERTGEPRVLEVKYAAAAPVRYEVEFADANGDQLSVVTGELPASPADGCFTRRLDVPKAAAYECVRIDGVQPAVFVDRVRLATSDGRGR